MAYKPFLIIQLRPEDEAADNELEAFMKYGGLELDQIWRVRIDKEKLPPIKLSHYSGLIVGGGPCNISDPEKSKTSLQKRYEKELLGLMERVMAADFPYLGACYGISLLNVVLGGRVSKEKYSETVEAIDINLTNVAQADPLTAGLPPSFRAFAGHKESCQTLGKGLVLLASSPACPFHMIRYGKNVYATQFHTELDQTGLALRINLYKHNGYFPPEDADKLIKAALKENITEPEKILHRFVERYSETW